MALEQMTVSLDDYIRYMIKKWKLLIGLLLAGGCLAGTATLFFGQEIVIQPSEKYAELKEQEASFLEYMENSVIMEMDPMNVYKRTLFLTNLSDQNALKDYIESGNVWENCEEPLQVKYLTELLEWQEEAQPEKVELELSHSDGETCEKLAEYIEEALQRYDQNLQIMIGTQRVVADQGISDEQMWCRNRLNDIQGQLEYTAAGCTITISFVTAVLFGAMIGGLLALVLCWGQLVFGQKVRGFRTKS